jgi:ribosomal protein L37AE/L43A
MIVVVVRERRPAGSAPGWGRAARHAARLLGGLPVHVVHLRKDRDGPRDTRNQRGRTPYQQAEQCPGCGRTDGVELTRTTSRVSAWKCTRCGLNWAASVINPRLRRDCPAALAARVERLSTDRLIRREVITLADEAPTLTDLELRGRLRALAKGAVIPPVTATPPKGRCDPCRRIPAQRVAQ